MCRRRQRRLEVLEQLLVPGLYLLLFLLLLLLGSVVASSRPSPLPPLSRLPALHSSHSHAHSHSHLTPLSSLHLSNPMSAASASSAAGRAQIVGAFRRLMKAQRTAVGKDVFMQQHAKVGGATRWTSEAASSGMRSMRRRLRSDSDQSHSKRSCNAAPNAPRSPSHFAWRCCSGHSCACVCANSAEGDSSSLHCAYASLGRCVARRAAGAAGGRRRGSRVPARQCHPGRKESAGTIRSGPHAATCDHDGG